MADLVVRGCSPGSQCGNIDDLPATVSFPSIFDFKVYCCAGDKCNGAEKMAANVNTVLLVIGFILSLA